MFWSLNGPAIGVRVPLPELIGLAQRHGFTIYDTIEGAVTLGREEVAVDGVLCIGEHGRYPTNDRGQIEDWFNSPRITTLIATAAFCLTALVIWELLHPAPIINLRLLKDQGGVVRLREA